MCSDDTSWVGLPSAITDRDLVSTSSDVYVDVNSPKINPSSKTERTASRLQLQEGSSASTSNYPFKTSTDDVPYHGDAYHLPSTPTFKYILGKMIGKGSYARVYLALNANNGELMAVKRVETPQTVSDRADLQQLEMAEVLKFERKILEDLEHPNIVQYLGFEETPYTFNIFLEYVPGGTIGSCLQKHGKFDQDVTKWFTSQILAGLEYLHSTGILHRDLKGDNILVQTSGVCKISDFEISKENMQGQAFTAMKGTAYWMAPEVLIAHNGRGYDSKVDIWSVGCVVLEMWTGERPWAGEEFIPVLFKLYEKLPPPVPPGVLSGLSELAREFRAECFAADPRQRPTAAVLRNHPYLQRTPGWVFQLSDIERSTPRLPISRSKRLSSRNSSARPPSLDTGTLLPSPYTPRPARTPPNEPSSIVSITPPKPLQTELSVADVRAEERQTSSSSDSDSISGTMWKRPPVKLQKARAPPPSPSKGNKYTH
ncbi:MAP kinase kinase kinase mkh1 [Mycena sanguinolenta]|uniref:MAP kinase kinase kinase mkh1 n=1 Tax=Mycena sanguinolenta TaxID=230812 RepID=A0A8H7DGD3_9AGAR|nr:MAP kinase kinase kinase mkh1 [Mycena sanguinolenta]